MTFKEAFDSGCRFKLPQDYREMGGWQSEVWWKKVSDNSYESTVISGERYLAHALVVWPEYFESNDWYLHPDDVAKKFCDKMEDLLNA